MIECRASEKSSWQITWPKNVHGGVRMPICGMKLFDVSGLNLWIINSIWFSNWTCIGFGGQTQMFKILVQLFWGTWVLRSTYTGFLSRFVRTNKNFNSHFCALTSRHFNFQLSSPAKIEQTTNLQLLSRESRLENSKL